MVKKSRLQWRWTMNNYHFTVIVRDARSDLSELEDWFYEVGCDDALLCSYKDTIYLEFDREAENAERAINSALENIRSLGFNDLIVEEQGYSTWAAIAERADYLAQTLSYMLQISMEMVNFHALCYRLASKSTMYFWPEVATWLSKQGKLNKNHYDVAHTAIS